MDIDQYQIILNDILDLLKSKNQIAIAVDGMSCSGKTTFSTYLQNYLYARVIHMDDFFLQDSQRSERRLNEIGGNLDYERFYREVVKPIQNHQAIHYHQYNCQTKVFTKKSIPEDYHLLVIEGAYALREEFQAIYDLSYLFFIDADEQLKRIKSREPRLYHRFIEEWIPMENRYIEALNLKQKVNRVVYAK